MADMCGDNRFELIELCKKDFLENTNISDAEKDVLDRMCFRMWQLGLLKKYEEINEQELDKLTNKYLQAKVLCRIDESEQFFINLIGLAFKAGYRKALEK